MDYVIGDRSKTLQYAFIRIQNQSDYTNSGYSLRCDYPADADVE